METIDINNEIKVYCKKEMLTVTQYEWLSLFPIIQDCVDNGYHSIIDIQFEDCLSTNIQEILNNTNGNKYPLFNTHINSNGNMYYITFGSYFIDTIDVFWPYKGTLSSKRRFQVLERDGFKCGYCGIIQEDTDLLHVDHILPRKYGGRNNMKNLITACIPCNLGKGDRIINTEGVKHVLTKSRKSNDSI